MKGQISIEEYIAQRPKTKWGGCGECYRRWEEKNERKENGKRDL